MNIKSFKKIIIIVCFIIIVFGLIGMNYLFKKNKTFYLNTYHVEFTTKSIDIFIPKYSYYEGDNGVMTAVFKNPKTYRTLKKEVIKYLDSLEEVSCNGNTYYYNSEQNFLIYKYKVSNGFPFRKIEIGYIYGNPCRYNYE